MRMSIRRFTRLTHAFSKKIESHIYAISIYFMHYNFARIHQTLRVTGNAGRGGRSCVSKKSLGYWIKKGGEYGYR